MVRARAKSITPNSKVVPCNADTGWSDGVLTAGRRACLPRSMVASTLGCKTSSIPATAAVFSRYTRPETRPAPFIVATEGLECEVSPPVFYCLAWAQAEKFCVRSFIFGWHFARPRSTSGGKMVYSIQCSALFFGGQGARRASAVSTYTGSSVQMT